MKNRLVFRILGALSSALIIVSIFVPFVSVSGYSQSLWEANEVINALYLPIMIIIFGVVGVLVFSTNIKTELAYASSGALLFYIITQIIPVIDEGMFNTLSVGFYCLAIGTVLTGIMAFICNLRIKVKTEEVKVVESTNEQESMLNQIDKLYNDQESTNDDQMLEISQVESLPIQPLGQVSVIEPLPVQPLQQVSQQNDLPPQQPVEQIDNSLTSVSENGNSVTNPFIIDNKVDESTDELSAPVAIQQQPTTQSITIQPNDQPLPMNNVIEPVNKIENPVAPQNPVTAEFEQPKEEVTNDVQQHNNVESTSTVSANLVTSEFEQPQSVVENTAVPTNPVTAEFGGAPQNPVTAEFGGVPVSSEEVIKPLGSNGEEAIQPISSGEPAVDVMADPIAKKSSDLDIFG